MEGYYEDNVGGFGLGLFRSGYRATMVMCEHKMNLSYWYQRKQTLCTVIVMLVIIVIISFLSGRSMCDELKTFLYFF
jgi:hypothetical protein